MRICTWNMRRATKDRIAAWRYISKINPDLLLLQEVSSIPNSLRSQYAVLEMKAQGKSGKPHHFSTAILVRGSIDKEVNLSSSWEWVNCELSRFKGNLLSAEVTLDSEKCFRVMSVYSPAWPVDKRRLIGIDVSQVKLKHNPDIWVTELMWAALLNEQHDGVPWIVAGDLNSSVTFDTYWGKGPRGNQEIQDRMLNLGFVECLHFSQGRLTPTFRNPRGGKITHQMDHLFVSSWLRERLVTCHTGTPTIVFDGELSDHLPIIAEFNLR
jgi:endonuclease/exonuclease/phosphatase family metal-dependent hydrolase